MFDFSILLLAKKSPPFSESATHMHFEKKNHNTHPSKRFFPESSLVLNSSGFSVRNSQPPQSPPTFARVSRDLSLRWIQRRLESRMMFFFPDPKCGAVQKPQNLKITGYYSIVITCYCRMFCFFSGDTCHKFPPNQKRNTHSIKNNTTSTATKPPPKPCHGPAHVFSCWRSSCYAYGLWRVLRRRPMRGGLGWFTLGSEWISCLLFAQKSGPVNFLKTHFGNSSSNDLVLEFRPLQIAWVNWEFYAELFANSFWSNIFWEISQDFSALSFSQSGLRFTLSPIIMVQWKTHLNKRKPIGGGFKYLLSSPPVGEMIQFH